LELGQLSTGRRRRNPKVRPLEQCLRPDRLAGCDVFLDDAAEQRPLPLGQLGQLGRSNIRHLCREILVTYVGERLNAGGSHDRDETDAVAKPRTSSRSASQAAASGEQISGNRIAEQPTLPGQRQRRSTRSRVEIGYGNRPSQPEPLQTPESSGVDLVRELGKR